MTTTSSTHGRGAWTSIGGTLNNGQPGPYYELAPTGVDPVGSTPKKGFDYLAVTYGVKAIQARCNQLTNLRITVDGWFGSATKAAVSAAQKVLGQTPDGSVGPATAKAMFAPLAHAAEAKYGIPAGYVCGGVSTESLFDPGAVGYSTPDDHGICQINAAAHPEVTADQAFDPVFAIDWMARYYAWNYAIADYGHRWDCAVASYNSPAWAMQWARTGTPPNPAIKQYAANVMAGC